MRYGGGGVPIFGNNCIEMVLVKLLVPGFQSRSFLPNKLPLVIASPVSFSSSKLLKFGTPSYLKVPFITNTEYSQMWIST